MSGIDANAMLDLSRALEELERVTAERDALKKSLEWCRDEMADIQSVPGRVVGEIDALFERLEAGREPD